MQKTCNEIGVPIVRVYGTTEHGKNEVDHVGGIGKTTLRRSIAGGKVFDSNKLVPDMVEYLQQKFSDNRQPWYEVIELQCQETEAARQESRRYAFGMIDCTSAFRSIVFKPNSTTISAANRICICELYE